MPMPALAPGVRGLVAAAEDDGDGVGFGIAFRFEVDEAVGLKGMDAAAAAVPGAVKIMGKIAISMKVVSWVTMVLLMMDLSSAFSLL